MYFFKHNIEEWNRDTFRYSYAEMGVFHMLRDLYYDREAALPVAQIDRMMRPQSDEEKSALVRVLADRFEIIQPDDDRAASLGITESSYVCWKIEDDIADYRDRAKTNQENGAKGGRPRGTGRRKPQTETKPGNNPSETQSVIDGNQTETPTTNYELLPNSEDKSSGAAAAEPPSPPALLDLDQPGKGRTAVVPLRPPLDHRAVLFDFGLRAVRKMTAAADRPARALLGKWLKATGDDAAALNQILVSALELKPADPVAWIEGAIRARSARPAPAWPDADDRAGWVEWVERGGDPRAKVEVEDGVARATLAGTWLCWLTGALCDAAKLPVRGVDWRAALDWLADGLDPHDEILPAITAAARNAPPGVSSIAFFDRAVRASRRNRVTA